MKTIEFGLNSKDVDRAIKELREYQEDIIKKTKLLAKRLADEGVNIARANIMEFDAVYSGELLASIHSEQGGMVSDGATYLIATNCNWAMYVEFGSGIIGLESPHPNLGILNWKYDINGHGDLGWYYFKDGAWHWTKGMPSRPFMYLTGVSLREKVESIAREVFTTV